VLPLVLPEELPEVLPLVLPEELPEVLPLLPELPPLLLLVASLPPSWPGAVVLESSPPQPLTGAQAKATATRPLPRIEPFHAREECRIR
jgi:hypothetical protein